MRTQMAWVAAVMGVTVATLALRAGEEKTPLDKVPKCVIDAVKARFAGAKLADAAKETEKDEVVYEVTLEHEGHKIDVISTPEGKLLLIEKEIASADVTEVVRKACDGKYPGARWKRVEEVTAVKDGVEKLDFYETLLETVDKKVLELQVGPDGTIRATEEKTKGDND